MILLHTTYQLAAFALGAVLGSFLALCVVRIPERMSVVSPPSHCPVCDTPLTWADNIPILSWLALRGRCRTCGTPISPAYPLVELTSGVVGWLLFRRFLPTPDHLELANVVAWTVWMLFAWLLMLAAFTDVRARIIPEGSSIYAIPVGIACSGVLEWLGYHGWLAIGLRQSVIGALLAGGLLWLVSELWFRVSGSEGLAGGDVRLMGMVGAFLGPVPGAWIVLLMASLLGGLGGLVLAAARGRSGYLPFGPAIAVAAITYVLWGDLLVRRAFPGLAAFL